MCLSFETWFFKSVSLSQLCADMFLHLWPTAAHTQTNMCTHTHTHTPHTHTHTHTHTRKRHHIIPICVNTLGDGGKSTTLNTNAHKLPFHPHTHAISSLFAALLLKHSSPSPYLNITHVHPQPLLCSLTRLSRRAVRLCPLQITDLALTAWPPSTFTHSWSTIALITNTGGNRESN